MLLEGIGKSFCKAMVEITENRELCKRIMQDLQIRFPVNAPAVTKKGYLDDDEQEWITNIELVNYISMEGGLFLEYNIL